MRFFGVCQIVMSQSVVNTTPHQDKLRCGRQGLARATLNYPQRLVILPPTPLPGDR